MWPRLLFFTNTKPQSFCRLWLSFLNLPGSSRQTGYHNYECAYIVSESYPLGAKHVLDMSNYCPSDAWWRSLQIMYNNMTIWYMKVSRTAINCLLKVLLLNSGHIINMSSVASSIKGAPNRWYLTERLGQSSLLCIRVYCVHLSRNVHLQRLVHNNDTFWYYMCHS